jgi:hypothetical protein
MLDCLLARFKELRLSLEVSNIDRLITHCGT